MKLIIAGATGFVATELIRQSLRLSNITSVVALARRPVPVPANLEAGSDASKLKSVVLEDFQSYPENVKKDLAGADACICPGITGGHVPYFRGLPLVSNTELIDPRTLAITPTKARSMEWDEVKKVCHTYAITGLKAIYEARNQSDGKKPFRFLYMSGSAAERDQTKTPLVMPQYCLMRGEVENQVLAFVKEHQGQIEASVVKPGLINEPGMNAKNIVSSAISFTGVLPSILVTEVSAAMLDQVANGFEKDPLTNADLVRIGQQALKR